MTAAASLTRHTQATPPTDKVLPQFLIMPRMSSADPDLEPTLLLSLQDKLQPQREQQQQQRHQQGPRERKISQEQVKEQQQTLSRRTTQVAVLTTRIERPSRPLAKDSTDTITDTSTGPSPSFISSPPPSSSTLPSPVSPVFTSVQTPITPTTPLRLFQHRQETSARSARSQSSSDASTSSPATVSRSFSCALPRPPPIATTVLSAASSSRVKRPSPLRQTSSPLPRTSTSPSKMLSASSVSLTPFHSTPMTSVSSSSSELSLSNFGMGGCDLPRPILRHHHHSHSVVRTSSPLRQQIGFDDHAKAPVVPQSAIANGTLRARRGRTGPKVAKAQTVHGTMDASMIGFHSQPILPIAHQASLGSRPSTLYDRPSTYHERPSTFHESQPSMDRTPRMGGSSIRSRTSLNSRAMPGNRPGSAPLNGLWGDSSDEIPANHPSTAMPGFPSVEFSDARAPTFSRASLRHGGVIMPVAAGRPRSTVTAMAAPPRVVKEVKFDKEPKETKSSSGLSGMVRKLSRRATSSPALKDKAVEQAKAAAALQKRTSTLQRRVSGDEQRSRSMNLPTVERRTLAVLNTGLAPLPERYSLGPRSPTPPSSVYGQLPPGFGLPSDQPRAPQQMGRGQPMARPTSVHGRSHADERLGRGPPRPQLRHRPSSPGLRPVPLEPLPEVSPTSPPLSPPVTYEQLAPLSPPLQKPARIPAFDDANANDLPGAPEVAPATPDEQAQPPPLGASLVGMGPPYIGSAPGGFAAQARNRSRSPSTFSLCSEASLHSTGSSQRSVSSLTSASTAASVDMPDPIAEDEGDVDAGIEVTSTSASIESHSISLRSNPMAVNEMIPQPLASPVDGAIIKMVARARTEPAVAMRVGRAL